MHIFLFYYSEFELFFKTVIHLLISIIFVEMLHSANILWLFCLGLILPPLNTFQYYIVHLFVSIFHWELTTVYKLWFRTSMRENIFLLICNIWSRRKRRKMLIKCLNFGRRRERCANWGEICIADNLRYLIIFLRVILLFK